MLDRQCLSATGHFAKLAVPLILEKLLSTSGSAKVRNTSFGLCILKIILTQDGRKTPWRLLQHALRSMVLLHFYLSLTKSLTL